MTWGEVAIMYSYGAAAFGMGFWTGVKWKRRQIIEGLDSALANGKLVAYIRKEQE